MQTHRAMLPLALAALTVGCYHPRQVSQLETSPLYEAPPPLEARVWQNFDGGIAFYTNRPAHVAVFEVVPERGVGLAYPSFGGQSRLVSGVRYLSYGFDSYRWAYQTQSFASLSPRPYYYLLVASDAPLRIDDFVGSPFALRRALSHTRYVAWRPFETMESLTQMVLPASRGAEYAVDVFTVWPQQMIPRNDSGYRLLNCNGRLIRVPAVMLLQVVRACATQQENVDVPTDSTAARPRALPPERPRTADTERQIATSPRAFDQREKLERERRELGEFFAELEEWSDEVERRVAPGAAAPRPGNPIEVGAMPRLRTPDDREADGEAVRPRATPRAQPRWTPRQIDVHPAPLVGRATPRAQPRPTPRARPSMPSMPRARPSMPSMPRVQPRPVPRPPPAPSPLPRRATY
ncbi:MAG: hypothetical protein ACRELV_12335 [Longimicrobiales bacterium]